jgi:hypothetical protein
MRDPLPPELARLGDELAAATARSAEADRRRTTVRKRFAVTTAAALLALAALAPAQLQPGEGPVRLAAAAAIGYKPSGCDRPRGATFAAARPCASPGSTDAELSDLSRRLAN